MSQRSISSFFKATPPKRPLASGDGVNKGSPAKKPKLNGSSSQGEDSKLNGNSSQDNKRSQEIVAERVVRQTTMTPALSANIGHTWFTALEPEFRKPYFRGLSAFLTEERKEKTIFPPAEDVFAWTTHCDIKDVKVVIIGQDPYHGPNQAHGLCFSVARKIPPPPSLVNIYKELVTDIPGFKHPGHGDLTGWAKQGVLLLNAVLTVRKGEPNTHAAHGWETLTDSVIKWINANMTNVVFLLWGAYAQKKANVVNPTKHLILKSVHPSPLSASRGFFGSRHFSKANAYLKENGKDTIDWKDLD